MGSCCSTSPNNDAQTKASTAATNEPPAPAATAEATANPHFTPPSQSSPNQTQKSSSGSKSTPIGNVLGRPMEDVRATYTIGKELGRGQFGVTYLCNQKQSGGHYACKTISKRKLVNKGDIEDVKREVQIMHHLMGQPNIVELRGAYQDKHSVHLVMELCAGGELFDRIIAKGPAEDDCADCPYLPLHGGCSQGP